MSIIIVGSSDDSPFLEPIDGVSYEMNAIVSRQRRFVATETNNILAPEHTRALQEFADWEQTFPVRRLSVGRSLYADVKPDSDWPVQGVKMKGGGGLQLVNDTWECYAPKPKVNYGKATEFHIALDEHLHVQTIEGTPKALNSLRAKAAQNEYDIQ